MTRWIIRALGPGIFYLLDQWIQENKDKKEMVKSYYNFLTHVDQSGQVKVANHLSGKAALKAKQQELLKELEDDKSSE